MTKYDIKVVNGIKYKTSSPRFVRYKVRELMKKWANLLSVTRYAFIEQQHEIRGSKREVIEIEPLLEHAIAYQHPDCEVFLVDPKHLREFFSTSHPDYDERKRRSSQLFRLLVGPEVHDTIRAGFDKSIDCMESALLIGYGMFNLDHLRSQKENVLAKAKGQPTDRKASEKLILHDLPFRKIVAEGKDRFRDLQSRGEIEAIPRKKRKTNNGEENPKKKRKTTSSGEEKPKKKSKKKKKND